MVAQSLNSEQGLAQSYATATKKSENVAAAEHKQIWALDSEFMMSGRAGHPEDVMTVQFSDGTQSYVVESAADLKRWLLNHSRIGTLYGFVLLCDLGSVKEWLGDDAVIISRRGNQLTGWIRYGRAKIHCVDAHPMLSSFGFRRLVDCGEQIKYPKLPKPEWLGLRKWASESEHHEFIKYAEADAVITSRIVRWLIENYGADPEKYVSAGSIAGHEFSFPRRLKLVKESGYSKVLMSPFESNVRYFTFAGRSEGFITGFSPNALYNDVASLYPCSIVATRALLIKGAVPCDFKELSLARDLNEQRFGWVLGDFMVKSDMWGLPVRGIRNYYMTGRISGLYSTFDLAAAKAEILNVKLCAKPTFREDDAEHNKYADMLMRKLEGKFSHEEKGYYKAILNAVSGKLGQAHPVGEKSNFLAYNILLGHSHLVMSMLFDKCSAPIIGMDTDSIFSQQDMSGTWFNVSDGQRTYPIRMDVKGRGDLAFFRSKRYIMKGEVSCYGSHGWRYFIDDYLKLFDVSLTELDSRIDIRATLLTRQREALKMAKGRWLTRPQHLDLEKLKALLSADDKRSRESSDSYGLVMAKKSMGSRAWNLDDYMRDAESDFLGVVPHQVQFRKLP
jgi:hypothetical protein